MDSVLDRVFHDIGNAVSVLNFYLEMVKSGDEVLSVEELTQMNHDIIVQLSVLKFAFLGDRSSRISEYLISYCAKKHKLLHIKSINDDFMRLIVNLVVIVVGPILKRGNILVNSESSNFSLTLNGEINHSSIKIIDEIEKKARDNPQKGDYLSTFLAENEFSLQSRIVSSNELEILLINAT